MTTTTEAFSYDIRPISRFSSIPAKTRRPKEFTCFSYDENHEYYEDDRSLKFYYPPRLGASLSAGFDTFRKHDDAVDEHLTSLLSSLTAYEKINQSLCQADIVTWRGMLTKIMISPYDNGSFEMNAIKFQGTIFIEENHEFKSASRAEQSSQLPRTGMPSQEIMSYWGYKFETISTLPVTWSNASRDFIEGREKEIVSNLAQYCSVVSTEIGSTNLILGGEVDAVWDQKPANSNDPVHWVELKTSAVIEDERDMIKYERKLLKYWAQSYLLGVPRIIVGMRDKSGELKRLEELSTEKIPALVKRVGKGIWDGAVCVNFAAAFLVWLRERLADDGTWRIRRKPQSNTIEVFRVELDGYRTILTPEFLAWRQRHHDK